MFRKAAAGVTAMLLVASCSDVGLAQAYTDLTAKKIIGFAADRVDTAYLREHVSQMEKRPLDGLMITARADNWPGRHGYRNFMWFGGARFTRQDFSTAIADLKATRFTRFTDNFLDFCTTIVKDPFISGDGKDFPSPPVCRPNDFDWFDKQWSEIADNGAVAAYVAREGGLKGLLIDVESYEGGTGPWKFPFLYEPYRQACIAAGIEPRSAADCARIVQQRGREFMEAVTAVYPDITIIFIQNTGWSGSSLIAPFVKGVFERKGQATIIDGGEGGYPLITHTEFANLRKQAASVHQADAVLKPMQYAFGIWVDRAPDKHGGWHTDPADFHRNYRSPVELENTLHGAMAASDRYVWLYVWHPQVWFNPHVTQKANLKAQAKQCRFCPHTGIPQAYLDAMRNSRKPHDLSWAPKLKEDRFIYFDDAVLVEGKQITAAADNMLDNPGFETWGGQQTSSPPAWFVNGQGPAVLREQTLVKSGKYSARLTTRRLQGHVLIDQHIPAARLAGKTVTLGVWIRTDLKEVAGIQILDLANEAWDVAGDSCPGDGKWHFVTATKAIRPGATGNVVFRLSAHIRHLKE